MAYRTAAVANEFLELAERDVEPLTPMKLQKLVYFAHGWYLAMTGEPLIEEPIEAWRYGPVVSSLYHEFKSFGATTPINRLARRNISHPRIDDVSGDNDLAKAIVGRVWQTYGRLTAVKLSNITHQPDTPWYAVAKLFDFNPPMNTEIPREQITEFFRQRLGEAVTQ